MNSRLLKQPVPKKFCRFVIPDSLAHKYRYITTEKSYVHDLATIFQFSPLLPTAETNIFLMEWYIWSNSCDDPNAQNSMCYRMAFRGYAKFEVVRNKVIFRERIRSEDDAMDFISFRGFPQKNMAE
jgi:hypothetical protein